jgi:hypothetical protein
VLVPGGRYAFTCWTPPATNPFMGLILGSVQKHGTTNVSLPPAPPMFRFGDPAECEGTLRAAGFVSVSTVELSVRWSFATPDDVVPGVVESTARLGPLLALQTPEQRRSIEQAIADGARTYTTDRGVEIPSPVILAVGRRP